MIKNKTTLNASKLSPLNISLIRSDVHDQVCNSVINNKEIVILHGWLPGGVPPGAYFCLPLFWKDWYQAQQRLFLE